MKAVGKASGREMVLNTSFNENEPIVDTPEQALACFQRTDMDALKDSLGVPSALRSCHTAVVGKFLIEGHVPAADVKKLISTAPKGVLGLAVPGMPSGSPGMEMAGRSEQAWR